MNDNRDITLKEFLLKIREYSIYLYKKRIIILLGAFLFALLFFYLEYKKKDKYKAQLTFMVNEDPAGASSSVAASLIGRFIGGTGKYNLEKILSLSRSRSIVEKTLLTKVVVDSSADLLANHFIREYELKNYDKNNKPYDYYFEVDSITDEKSSQMMTNIYDLLTGDKGIYASSVNEKSGIMTIELTSTNEDLSITFINRLFDVLSLYYIEKAIAKDMNTYNLLKKKLKELYGKMNYEIDESYAYNDQILGAWQETARLPSIKKTRDSKITTEVYAEVLKNLEIAEFTLNNNTPFIQRIDFPRKPLNEISGHVIKFSLIGLILGGVFVSLILIFRKIIHQALNS